MQTFISGPESQQAYAEWKKDWSPPANVRALGGRLIVEFGPAASISSLIVPEGASYNAMVVHDSKGELRAGTEVIMLALNGQNFTHEGRVLTIVNYEDILGVSED